MKIKKKRLAFGHGLFLLEGVTWFQPWETWPGYDFFVQNICFEEKSIVLLDELKYFLISKGCNFQP